MEDIVLSICIPTYNRKELLLSNVSNILAYEENDLEVIVVDNASTDGSWEELSKIKDPRLHIYRNKMNFGASYNYGKAPLFASGKYIMILNDRDHVEIHEIREFIQDISNKDVDVILTPGNVQINNLNTIEERTYWRICFMHPGYFIYSKGVCELEERWNNVDLESISLADLEEIRNSYTNNILLSNKWYCYTKAILVKQPQIEKLVKIKQERESVFGRIYFTFESHYEQLKVRLRFKLKDEKHRKGYVLGVCRSHFYRVWRDYIWAIESGEVARYNYTPPRRIWWLKEMFQFYQKIRLELEKEECCCLSMIKTMRKVFLKEYINCLLYRMTISKKKHFPKPWFKNNYIK